MSAGGRAGNAAQDGAAAPSSAGSAAGSGRTSMPDDSCQSRARFFGDLSPAHYQAVGGTEAAVLAVTTSFYTKVFADPILAVMFRSHDESHAYKLALFVMNFMEITDKFFRVSSISTLHAVHHAAQQLPSRSTAPPGAGCPGGNFTASQRDAWKSHFVAAFREHGARGGLLQDISDFVDRGMRFYGPFVGDRSDK